jgi:hypothetical protein
MGFCDLIFLSKIPVKTKNFSNLFNDLKALDVNGVIEFMGEKGGN